MKTYLGILAGGSGERLWPLSTKQRPKQLIPFINGKSLFSLTVSRLSGCVSDQKLFVVAISDLSDALQKEAGDAVSFYIQEPASRNTAPAILLSSLKLYEQDPESVIGFFPADHFIPDTKAFQKIITQAIDHAKKNDVIVTIGLQPTYPATGYGYIQADKQKRVNTWYPALQFCEKPELQRAQNYVERGDMFWNAGMFLAKTKVFLEEFQLHSPLLWDAMQRYFKGDLAYAEIAKIAVDYAIMEKSKRMVIFPAQFEWYDVGNMTVFLKLKNQFNGISSQVINIQGSNNLVETRKKIVACVGVSNLCIIETDDELLILSQEHAESVRQISVELSKKIEIKESVR